ncbi:PAS domain-containing hybrid sensor histidine kinase/response regulator [Desulfogranum japonicum]|uniref:PAS domain-containing hybrid sensor histidine kinase/response regulator n=1 Tax=Desulfogranum japonicum TaxID=231447 RepID=UPI00068511C7|nr:PAS domain-containing protein [Desulfogranum japonicum]
MTETGSNSHTLHDRIERTATNQAFFSEKLFRYFIKHCPSAAAIYDRNMVCLACSDRYLQDYEVSEEQVIGKKHYEVFPEMPQKWRDIHKRVLRGAVEKNDTDCFVRLDGSVCHTSWECRPWYDAEGKIGGIILYSDVITDQVRILQEAKAQAEQDKKQLEAVLSNMDSGVVVFDMEGSVILANNALASILEYKDKSELPLNIGFFEHLYRRFSYPERKEIPLDEWPLKRLYRGETVDHEKFVVSHLETKRERIVEYFGTPVCNANGDPELQLLILTDITERQQAEEELRATKEFAEQEQAKWLAILDHISNGVTVYDTSANRIYANRASAMNYKFDHKEEKFLNWQFIVNNYAIQTYPDRKDLKSDEWPTLRVLRGEHLNGEIFCFRRLGFDFEHILKIFGVPIYNAQGDVVLAVLASHDITEEVEREKQDKLMQERMAQTQRLESLGVLAGGIAHDFNNLLMGILGHADLALLKLSQPSSVAINLENIKTATLQAADLCTQLLAYSGQGKIEEKEFSMSKLISEMTQMLKTSISKNCLLNLNLEEQLPLTVGDPSQMRQIVMNFVINASESIGDREGTINISTGSMYCSQEYFSDNFLIKPLNAGPYVMLTVSDNGPGMDRETLGRIFDPFFTTKFTGRGLGLSAVLGIIQSHDGGLGVYSEPNVGTTFKVFLPAVHSTSTESPARVEGIGANKEHLAGKVLLVDDEELVLEVCTEQLELLGLEALTARNGQEGVEVYREKQDEIDLVILDLTMPKMGGEETFRILRQLNPEIKVVLASGYAEEEMTKRFAEEKPSGYLRKPYTFKELSSVLFGLLPEQH